MTGVSQPCNPHLDIVTFKQPLKKLIESLERRRKIKRRLEDILQALIGPIRERRAQLARHPAYVLDVIRSGTEKARSRTEATKREVVGGLGLFML